MNPILEKAINDIKFNIQKHEREVEYWKNMIKETEKEIKNYREALEKLKTL